VYAKALLAQKGKVSSIGNVTTILTAPGAVHLYDGMNLAALAMIEANSTKSSVFTKDIIKIGNGTPGAKIVTSFAQGVAALKAGKSIRYEGPGGPTNFDAYHDSVGIFQVDKYSANGSVQVVGNLTAAQLRANA
jgi:branched-chain amino acid transport system substrate-binding protein